MHFVRAFLLVALSGPFIFAQSPVLQLPPTPQVITNPGSQVNLVESALTIRGRYRLNGVPVGTLQTLLPSTGPSTTLPWIVDPNLVSNDVLELATTVKAFPESPFTLAALSTPGPLPCCTFNPWLPGFTPFLNFGWFHLGAGAVKLFDGLGLFGQPDHVGVTDTAGFFRASGDMPLTDFNHVTFQALLVDPASPLGLRFSAALAVTKHI